MILLVCLLQELFRLQLADHQVGLSAIAEEEAADTDDSDADYDADYDAELSV